jgi:L-serine kinase (ADP)
MTNAPEFALVPIAKLLAHEMYEEENVVDLVAEIEHTGVFADPIWVARDSLVILNGHHRVEALRRLGVAQVPAWLLDYHTDVVSLEPWRPGLPITKLEVERRAQDGKLFPPKTTRHLVRADLPPRPVALSELPRVPRGRAYPRATVTSGRRGSRISGSG